MADNRQIKGYVPEVKSYCFLSSNSFDMWLEDEPQQAPRIIGSSLIIFSIAERKQSIFS